MCVCRRFQFRGRIFEFIGAERGPIFGVEAHKLTQGKVIPPPVVGVCMCLLRCNFAVWARTVCAFNKGAFMLYNITAPWSNPTLAALLNARFSVEKKQLQETLSVTERLETPMPQAPKARSLCFDGTSAKPLPIHFEPHVLPGPKGKNKKRWQVTLPSRWPSEIPVFVVFGVSNFVLEVVVWNPKWRL